MNVPAAEEAGGVNAFLELNLEEGCLGQAKRKTPSWLTRQGDGMASPYSN
jgi:hypothetical protein